MYPSPLSTIPFRVKTNIFQLRVYIWSLTPPYTHEGPTTTLHDEMMLYSTLLSGAICSIQYEYQGMAKVLYSFISNKSFAPRRQRTPYCMHYSRRNCRF